MQTTFSFLHNSSRKKPNCFSEPVYRGAPGTAASAKPAEWWRSAQWHEATARGTPRAQGRASPSGSNLSSPLLSGSSNSTQIKLLKNFFPLGAGGIRRGRCENETKTYACELILITSHWKPFYSPECFACLFVLLFFSDAFFVLIRAIHKENTRLTKQIASATAKSVGGKN